LQIKGEVEEKIKQTITFLAFLAESPIISLTIASTAILRCFQFIYERKEKELKTQAKEVRARRRTHELRIEVGLNFLDLILRVGCHPFLLREGGQFRYKKTNGTGKPQLAEKKTRVQKDHLVWL
jgi:hypothetical protein